MRVIVWSKDLSTLNFYAENLEFLELSLKKTAKVWNPKRSTIGLMKKNSMLCILEITLPVILLLNYQTLYFMSS